jgi:hypothetical protein
MRRKGALPPEVPDKGAAEGPADGASYAGVVQILKECHLFVLARWSFLNLLLTPLREPMLLICAVPAILGFALRVTGPLPQDIGGEPDCLFVYHHPSIEPIGRRRIACGK